MSSTKFVRPHRPSVEELAQGVLAGTRALLGRAIPLVESNAAGSLTGAHLQAPAPFGQRRPHRHHGRSRRGQILLH